MAFAPVDFNVEAMVDEWSGDYGCGVKYFSQDGVIKLAQKAGIKVMMITGDNALTAVAVAKSVNIYKEGDLVVLAAFGSGFTWGSVVIRW